MKHSTPGCRAVLGASLLAASLVTACSDGSSATETHAIGRAQSAVVNGKPSTSAQDAVVLLIHYESNDPYGVGSCTGTLLSDRIVLTARHCIADTDPYAACDEDGNALQAGAVRSNHRAASLYVFTGKDRPDFSRGEVKPAAQGLRIVDDGSKTLCNADIALVVLDKPIAGAKIAPIRLETDVTKGETITAVGWGVTDVTPQPEVRQQRSGIKVTAVGPDKTALPPVAGNEFQVGESICSGDSGGPAFAESTGAVVGVVSRGGNGRQSRRDPSAACIGADAENIYTKVTPFKDIVMKAFELVQAEPWIEGQPDPRLAVAGSPCADPAECRSNLCLADPSAAEELTCAQDCSNTDCPEGQVCAVESDVQVCRSAEAVAAAAAAANPPKTGAGCASAPSSSSDSGRVGLALGLAALGIVVARRRRG